MRAFPTLLTGLLAACLALAAPGAGAQNLFAPAITVNDDTISAYELEQRQRFLQLLRAPGDPAILAREALIDDMLKRQAIAEEGIEITEEQLFEGQEEFAARADLSREEFIRALEGAGVSAQTFRDFVEVGLGWREFVRRRFLGAARPSDDEIARAIGTGTTGSGVRVLLSEIIMPLTPQNIDQVQLRAERLAAIRSQSEFSAAARRFSATNTRDRGGRMDWMPVTDLPPQLRPLILNLSVNEVTEPISLPNAVALFQLRAIEEIPPGEPTYSEIEYAAYYIPGGRTEAALAEAARIETQVDRCDDLYGVAQGQPEERLERQSVAPAEIPADVALELAKLDPGEVSTALTRSNGQTLVFLMLCGRTGAQNAEATREEVGNALLQGRLAAFSESYLEQQRANAVIVER